MHAFHDSMLGQYNNHGYLILIRLDPDVNKPACGCSQTLHRASDTTVDTLFCHFLSRQDGAGSSIAGIWVDKETSCTQTLYVRHNAVPGNVARDMQSYVINHKSW
jgi:hypothetical protein